METAGPCRAHVYGLSPSDHGQKNKLKPSDRLKKAPAAGGSRNQNWKFQVEPTVIGPAAGRDP